MDLVVLPWYVVVTVSLAGEDVVSAAKWAEALVINWGRSVLGPDSICVAVVDPWELQLGVTNAMDTDCKVGGMTDGGSPVRTDCVSGAPVAPDTYICVGGAAELALVGAAEGAGFVSEVLACISPRLMRSRIKRWYPSSSKLSNCSLAIQLWYFPRPRPGWLD